MTLQLSGPISIADIVAEFGGTAPHRLSEYYAGGSYVPAGSGNVPASGLIRLSDFYGAGGGPVLPPLTGLAYVTHDITGLGTANTEMTVNMNFGADTAQKVVIIIGFLKSLAVGNTVLSVSHAGAAISFVTSTVDDTDELLMYVARAVVFGNQNGSVKVTTSGDFKEYSWATYMVQSPTGALDFSDFSFDSTIGNHLESSNVDVAAGYGFIGANMNKTTPRPSDYVTERNNAADQPTEDFDASDSYYASTQLQGCHTLITETSNARFIVDPDVVTTFSSISAGIKSAPAAVSSVVGHTSGSLAALSGNTYATGAIPATFRGAAGIAVCLFIIESAATGNSISALEFNPGGAEVYVSQTVGLITMGAAWYPKPVNGSGTVALSVTMANAVVRGSAASFMVTNGAGGLSTVDASYDVFTGTTMNSSPLTLSSGQVFLQHTMSLGLPLPTGFVTTRPGAADQPDEYFDNAGIGAMADYRHQASGTLITENTSAVSQVVADVSTTFATISIGLEAV